MKAKKLNAEGVNLVLTSLVSGKGPAKFIPEFSNHELGVWYLPGVDGQDQARDFALFDTLEYQGLLRIFQNLSVELPYRFTRDPRRVDDEIPIGAKMALRLG